MFDHEIDVIREDQSRRYILLKKDKALSYRNFLSNLQGDDSFRSFFIDLLAEVPYRAFQWETPPVTKTSIQQPFEFVIHKSPAIDLPPDPGPFRQYFGKSDTNKGIAVFNNLGNDARLVAPEPTDRNVNYSHIGVFTQQASSEQQHELWRATAEEMEKQLTDQPRWLNTAGGGVAWLHIRIDSRPKYYQHAPYREPDQ